jgi:hypothetical protein
MHRVEKEYMPQGKPRSRWKDNIKIVLRVIVWASVD